jgi:hypothetical protein
MGIIVGKHLIELTCRSDGNSTGNSGFEKRVVAFGAYGDEELLGEGADVAKGVDDEDEGDENIGIVNGVL